MDWDPDLESQISKKTVHESDLADSRTILGGVARRTEDANEEERRWRKATLGERLLPPARRNGALTIRRNDLENGTSQLTTEPLGNHMQTEASTKETLVGEGTVMRRRDSPP